MTDQELQLRTLIDKLERENAALWDKVGAQRLSLAYLTDAILGEDALDRSDRTLVEVGCRMARENAALRADNQAAHALILDLRTKEHSERTLAVKLEKDNAVLRELVSTLGAPSHVNVSWEKWKKMREENTALRADKERLDWLQNGGNAVDDVLYDMNVQIDFDVRAAIDAARKEQP